MFALAELVRSAIEQNERRSGDANVTIACYRFQTVRIIRVRADEGVSFQLSTDASAKPFSDFGVVATRAPTQVAGNRTANNPWLEVVARFADHFLTSGAGNEVMLVRLLGDQA